MIVGLQAALDRLDTAIKALDDFRASYYMPWQGDEDITAADRAASERIRKLGQALNFEYNDAVKNVVAVARLVAKQ